MFALQQKALAACYDKIRPGHTIADIINAAAAFSNDDYECRLLMHARGLGDDSPIAIYSARDKVMSDWQLEAGATFIVKPEADARLGLASDELIVVAAER